MFLRPPISTLFPTRRSSDLHAGGGVVRVQERHVLAAGLEQVDRLVGVSPPDGLGQRADGRAEPRSEEHTSELQSRRDLVCRLLLEKKNTRTVLLSGSH